MKMKQVRNLLLTLIICGIFSACDDMLEPKVFMDISSENFFETEGDCDAALTGLYAPLHSAGGWGYSDIGTADWDWYASLYSQDAASYYLRCMLSTDELAGYFISLTGAVQEYNFGPSTWSMSSSSVVYNIIRFVARATDAIDRIDKAGNVNELVRERYVAEAKVLRAYYMYILYDLFGPVNAKLDPETLTDKTITPRPSKEVYCAQIIRDLDDAIATAGMPESYNQDANNWGRMSKGIARMLKLKLYMHNKEWSNAEATAREIMGMETYALLDNYKDVFNKSRNSEVIFGIPCNEQAQNVWLQEVLHNAFKSSEDGSFVGGSGWRTFYMPWNFYDKMFANRNDSRLNTILDRFINSRNVLITREQTGSTGIQGAIPLKYMDTGDDLHLGHGLDIVVFRLADVQLLLAEAINEQHGPTEEAIKLVEEIADRANTSIPAEVKTGQSAFRQFILDERARELYCEGTRRQDLVRNGTLIQNARNRGYTMAQDHMTVYPIPQDVIIEGGGIIFQNEGYTE